MARDATRDRIAAAALECLSTTPVGTLTVRTIAARAGVNLATVHYHFGTKEAVVTAALRQFFEPVFAFSERPVDPALSARQQLEAFLVAYTDGFHRHPGVFLTLLETIMVAGVGFAPPSTYGDVLLEVIGRAKGKVAGLIREVAHLHDETLVAYRTLQVMTSLLHPLLISPFPQSQFGVNFKDEETRRRYIATLLDALEP